MPSKKFSLCLVQLDEGYRSVWIPEKTARPGLKVWVKKQNVEEPEDVKGYLLKNYFDVGVIKSIKPAIDGSNFNSEQLNQVFGKHNVK